jgi:hypothetical protein
MSTPKNAVYKWLRVATPAQARELAKAAQTSIAHLRHIAAGRRQVSADMGQRLATASRTLKHRALYLDQQALCRVCRVCPLVESRKTKAA